MNRKKKYFWGDWKSRIFINHGHRCCRSFSWLGNAAYPRWRCP